MTLRRISISSSLIAALILCLGVASLAHAIVPEGDSGDEAPLAADAAVGTVFLNDRLVDGYWPGPQVVDNPGSATRAEAVDVSVAGMPNSSTQLAIVTAGGIVLHRIKDSSGAWSAFVPVNGPGTTFPTLGSDVSIAGMPDGSTQLVMVGTDASIYHAIRSASGQWSQFVALDGPGTQVVAHGRDASVVGLPTGASEVTIAGTDGIAYTRSRSVAGTWTEFEALDVGSAPAGFSASRISTATTPNRTIHFGIVGTDAVVYRAKKDSQGNWSPLEALPPGATGAGVPSGDIALAGMPDGSTQLAVVGIDGAVHHGVMTSLDEWSGFAVVVEQTSYRVALASVGSGVARLAHTTFVAPLLVDELATPEEDDVVDDDGPEEDISLSRQTGDNMFVYSGGNRVRFPQMPSGQSALAADGDTWWDGVCTDGEDRYSVVKYYVRNNIHPRMEGDRAKMYCGKETRNSEQPNTESPFGIRHIRDAKNQRHKKEYGKLGGWEGRSWGTYMHWVISWTLEEPSRVTDQNLEANRFCYEKKVGFENPNGDVEDRYIVVILGATGTRIMTSFPRKKTYCAGIFVA